MDENIVNHMVNTCDKLRILIVEDDEDSAYTLSMQLSLLGYSDVKVVRDGESAIIIFNEMLLISCCSTS